jgi:hypothetical protein
MPPPDPPAKGKSVVVFPPAPPPAAFIVAKVEVEPWLPLLSAGFALAPDPTVIG